MKRAFCILSMAASAVWPASAQVKITADDMFNQVGLTYQAYSNPFDPNALSPTPFPVPTDLLGTAGPNQVWDFSKGPTNVVYRFDYVAPKDIDATIAAGFPDAQIVERKTDLANGHAEYLFFSQVPGVGRKVYGFYLDNPSLDPSNVFTTPIVDFPSEIAFGQQWTTVATYLSNVKGTDPTDPGSGGFSVAVQTTQTSDLKVDAWGTIVLPDELGGFGQGLRINEAVTIDVSFDDGSGTFQHVETDYARNFYWLMPGRGIVAALASTQSATLPSDNFSTATQFWRMFQTNKKPSTTVPCTAPEPVADLRIRYNSGQVLLSWSKAPCATQYRLDYADASGNPLTWQPLGMFTNQLFSVDNAAASKTRFYRVVSIK